MGSERRPRRFAAQLRSRIEALAEGWQLPDGSVARLLALVELLEDDLEAPTTIRDPLRAIDDHLADSLAALELDVVRSASMIADLGTGAGFPGLPLAIAMPATRLALVESSGRKAMFVRRAVEACAIGNASVINLRAEEWDAGVGRHELVTARALASLSVVAEYAAPLLRVGGALVVWRGRRDVAEEGIAANAALELGLEVAEPRRVIPYPGAEHRYLHLMLKVRDTPARFPRRPGVAAKRPLGR